MATDRSKKTRALQKASEKNVMLAHKFNPKLHVLEAEKKKERPIKEWYIHEKIDGIRAVFKDGELTSRYGNKFHAPPEFLKKIQWGLSTSIQLDGELIHPDGLQRTGSIVRDKTKKNTMEYWSQIQYVVFDQIYDYEVPFWERLKDLQDHLAENENVRILDKMGVVTSINDVHTYLKVIEGRDGEGLILRNPEAFYEKGRSWNLIKVKSFEDCEAEITGYYKGEGKYTGMIGGLECKLSDGTEFECGTGLTDEDRAKPPAVGKKITIKFMGLTDSGKPRHAVFMGVRDYE
tara:strand:- start:158000 stop:158869 length:870 start_codon:yes stop_codon:yes gene_type:complete